MDWGDLYDSIQPLNGLFKAIFLFFICFTFVALVNIIAAVFIKCAFVRTESDREFMTQKEVSDKQNFMDKMRNIFEELDQDKSGNISYGELKAKLKTPAIG